MWGKFMVYLTAVALDAEGNRLGFYSVKAQGEAGQAVELQTGACHHIELLMYAIAEEFPASRTVRDSPDFMCSVVVSADGEIMRQIDLNVNPWGGATLPATVIP